MPLEEIVISRHVDTDFGVLELTETRTVGGLKGGPSRPLIIRQWVSKLADFDLIILND